MADAYQISVSRSRSIGGKMADVSGVYRKVWSSPEARAAADAASNAYSAAAAQSGESACFRGGISYGSNGSAESVNFATFRQCGKDFGSLVSKASKGK